MKFLQCQVERNCFNEQTWKYFVAAEFTWCESDWPGLFLRHQKATKKTIPYGQPTWTMPYGYAECKTLHRILLQCLKTKHNSILAAKALLKFERWIRDTWFRSDYALSQSRRKVLGILKYLTGRSQPLPHCLETGYMRLLTTSWLDFFSNFKNHQHQNHL